MKKISLITRPNPLKSASKFLLLAGFTCLIGSPVFAANQTWTGAVDSNFQNVANWSASSPGAVTPANGVGIFIVGNGNVATMSTAGGSGRADVYADTTLGAAPIWNIVAGGFESCNGSSIRIGSYGTNFGGILNQTGGEISAANAAQNINIAASGAGQVNASGTYNFGGLTNTNKPIDALGNGGGFAVVNVGQSAGETGVLNLTGYGVFNTAGTQTLNGLTGAQGVGGQMNFGSSGGRGTMSVTGGNLTIITGTLTLGNTTGTANLNETIDSTNISTINIGQKVLLGTNAYFNLTLGSGFAATASQVFTLIADSGTWTGTFTNLANGGTITDVGTGYQFQAAYGNTGMTLTVTAVPEPSAVLLVLCGLTGMGLTLRRRK